MTRIEIINTIGVQFLTSNIENGEFSYAVALGGLANLANSLHYKIDLRFYDKTTNTVILVETKQRFRESDESQLFSYVENEKRLCPEANITAMLANTANNKIKVWKINGKSRELLSDRIMKTMAEYSRCFIKRNKNDKTKVLENTSQLNKILHDNGISEKLRSQFVGTCLLALKHGLRYEGLESGQIIAGIKSKLNGLLGEGENSALKIRLLDSNILSNQNVRNIESTNFSRLLNFIKDNILPYIDAESNEGQDILSYFFTTFNKYVAREDKNQAFTPNHIAHFMVKIGGIHKYSRVLDPTCGSGTFLVQAMSQELKLCETDLERENVKKNQIYGIEFDENVFGLSTTNMLIHGDGNSNIYMGSCFNKSEQIKEADIDLILMNPPYNASRTAVSPEIAKLFGASTTDPTKGLSFVHYIAEQTKGRRGRLVTLLPMACAITTRDGLIMDFKEMMLEHHTLDAVFSFPDDMFYPGASAVACCMVFDLGKPHAADYETFFGYFKNDGFEKRKGVGRVDVNDRWSEIEKEWIRLYTHRETKAGYSVTRHVDASDEWCSEAYMETDFTNLSSSDFINTLREYSSFLLKISNPNKPRTFSCAPLINTNVGLPDTCWKEFKLDEIFTEIYKARPHVKAELTTSTLPREGFIPFVSRTEANNGCDAFVSKDDDIEIQDGNALIIGDTTATIFYQSDQFTTGDHIVVCKAPWLNKYTAQFIKTVLDLERYRFNYGRAFKMQSIKRHKIHLPANAQNNPDWDFIENYIKSLPYSSCL